MQKFTPSYPCASSELVHFRNRMGEKGIELILQESIRVNNKNDDDCHHATAFIDSTVQEKNVTFPTDARSHKKIVSKVLDIVHKLNLPLRQSHTFVLKRVYRDQRFRNHPKNRDKAGRAGRKLKRNLPDHHGYARLIGIFGAILSQRRDSRKKIHSIHEPEAQCIGKGKEHKKFEFGNKVSVIRSDTGIILGTMSFRNEHDGHTMESALEQVERLTGRKIQNPAGDRGYRNRKEINGTKILIADVPKRTDSRHQRMKKHRLFRKRAGIEPTIGHLKSDYRLGRNFYKGVAKDAVNILLAAAAYNFKRAMKALLSLLIKLSEILGYGNISLLQTF